MKNSFLVLIIFSMMIFPINAFALDADEDLLYDQGVEHYNNGNYNQAIKDFEAVLRANPNNSEAKEQLEKVRKESGYYEAQVAAVQAALATPSYNYSKSSKTYASSSEEEVKTRFGLRFAIPIMIVDYNDEYPETGFGLNGLSFVLSIPILSRITIEPEIDVLNYRFFWGDLEHSYKFEEYAISVPLTLRFVTSPPPRFGIYAEAGAQLDFAISTEYTEFDEQLLDEPEPMDERNFFGYGLVFGGGFQFRIGDMVVLLGYRYVNSLTDFITYEDEGYGKLTQHQISLGLLF